MVHGTELAVITVGRLDAAAIGVIVFAHTIHAKVVGTDVVVIAVVIRGALRTHTIDAGPARSTLPVRHAAALDGSIVTTVDEVALKLADIQRAGVSVCADGVLETSTWTLHSDHKIGP